MRVCEVCGSTETEENEDPQAINRRILYVCENCRNDRRTDFDEEQING